MRKCFFLHYRASLLWSVVAPLNSHALNLLRYSCPWGTNCKTIIVWIISQLWFASFISAIQTRRYVVIATGNLSVAWMAQGMVPLTSDCEVYGLNPKSAYFTNHRPPFRNGSRVRIPTKPHGGLRSRFIRNSGKSGIPKNSENLLIVHLRVICETVHFTVCSGLRTEHCNPRSRTVLVLYRLISFVCIGL